MNSLTNRKQTVNLTASYRHVTVEITLLIARDKRALYRILGKVSSWHLRILCYWLIIYLRSYWLKIKERHSWNRLWKTRNQTEITSLFCNRKLYKIIQNVLNFCKLVLRRYYSDVYSIHWKKENIVVTEDRERKKFARNWFIKMTLAKCQSHYNSPATCGGIYPCCAR